MRLMLLLFLVILPGCGKSRTESASNTQKQIVMLHFDAKTIAEQTETLTELGLSEEEIQSGEIVIIARTVLEEDSDSLQLVDAKEKKKNREKRRKQKKEADAKEEKKKKDKSEPNDGSHKIKKVKDAGKAKDLKASDVYENRKRRINKYAIVPKDKEVYRGMQITRDVADKILKDGIDAPAVFNRKTGFVSDDRDVLNTIKKHQKGEGDEFTSNTDTSIFVSTSKSSQVATEFAGSNGIVFKIKTEEDKSIDVNKARGEKSEFPREKEISIVGRIIPESIIGYFSIRKGPPPKLGDFKCNTPCLEPQEYEF